MPDPGLKILPLEDSHRPEWERLYQGYAEFYRTEQTSEMRARVWGWIHDPAHEVNGFIAIDGAGRAVGITHYRPFARPLSATIGGFLDDLFVDPASRGQRVADALIGAVADVGRQKGWSVIRWITAENNYRGRGVYDRVATLTPWKTYDIKL
ncbi:GNAT family N-acetyltransferase [Roseomonas sp. 18066]|uniref:GNAT family N-acetyltransferase n=1 Tax=Roseomonas sp. 18066 TaxID=2681412 RepID=UPI0013586365|nr:GNAT family N-acetyltransferase [Roseomonas sp. 18066]